MTDPFFSALRASPKKRLDLQRIRRLWIECRPDLTQHPNRDGLLLEALQAGEREGVLKLPSSRSFERLGNPAMPLFITIVFEVVQVMRTDWSSVSWMPELGFWMQLSEREKVTAQQINTWLIARKGYFMTVPLRERSLDIFGDEKYLDGRVRDDALFGGRLPLSAIGARKVDYPMPYRPQLGPPGRPVLVVENHHSFFSLGEWNTSAARYAAIVFGSGAAITSTGSALDEVLREVEAVGAEYFGDLDPEGVSIPLRYNLNHEGQLQPAIWLYRMLLSVDRHRPLTSDYSGDMGALTSWVPGLAQEIHGLWSAGKWLPQEGVGLEQLLVTSGIDSPARVN